jgi:excisionase family DNA binding protein
MNDEVSDTLREAAGEPAVAEAPSSRARALREEMLGSALTLDEIAYILSLDRTTVAKYLREGTIVGFQIGREWRVTEEELRNYFHDTVEGRRGQPSEPPTTGHRGILAELLSKRPARPRLPQPASSTKFDKFTTRARRVLSLAQEEAQRLNHHYIGTEHLLLGLVRENEGVAAQVLARLGVELERVRSGVEFVIGRGDKPVSGEVGLTPRSKKVIELAVDEARRLGHHYIGTEHLLLGLVREGEGVAAGVLESLNLKLDEVRAETLRVLNAVTRKQDEVAPVEPPPVPPEASGLTGTGEEAWTCTFCGARSPLYFRHCFNCGASHRAEA